MKYHIWKRLINIDSADGDDDDGDDDDDDDGDDDVDEAVVFWLTTVRRRAVRQPVLRLRLFLYSACHQKHAALYAVSAALGSNLLTP